MDVIILDSHLVNDGRIIRHIKYLLDQGITVYRLHYNIFDTSIPPGKFSQFGERGFRINISRFKGKYRTLSFLIYCIRHKIAEDCYLALNNLHFDTTHFVIIHVHDPQLLPLAQMLIKNNHFKAKIVYDRHEIYEKLDPHFGINIAHIYEKISTNFIQGVVIISESHSESTRKLFPTSSIITVPNYPSTSDYDKNRIIEKIQLFNTHSKINMIYIGSLNNLGDRDVNLLLKIADRVLLSSCDVNFIVGGTYNLDSKCTKKMEDLSRKFPDRFLFLGTVPRQKTIELTQNAHIGFYLIRPETSYWVKYSPNKVYEYLICGTIPVIRVDIDHAEVISKCGLLFYRDDSDDVIIKSIMNLITHTEKIKEYMKCAQDMSDNYTWESVACRYIDLYNSLLK
jgi:glycosyltransferase involved in cell wall biosynthesis